MNRRERAIVRTKREALAMAKEFKNDAIASLTQRSFFDNYEKKRDNVKSEISLVKAKQKDLYKAKGKFNGCTGYMTENNYWEIMGA